MKCHKIWSENIFSLKHRCHLPFHRTKWRMKITQKCAYLNQSPAPWGPTRKPKLTARHTLCLLPRECRAEGAGKSLKGTLYSAPYLKVTSQISGHSTLTDGLDGIIFIVWMEEAKLHRKEGGYPKSCSQKWQHGYLNPDLVNSKSFVLWTTQWKAFWCLRWLST